MHLEGARSIYETIPETVKSAAGFEFLKPWFQYHYIFSQYTYPPQVATSHLELPSHTAGDCQVSCKLDM